MICPVCGVMTSLATVLVQVVRQSGTSCCCWLVDALHSGLRVEYLNCSHWAANTQLRAGGVRSTAVHFDRPHNNYAFTSVAFANSHVTPVYTLASRHVGNVVGNCQLQLSAGRVMLLGRSWPACHASTCAAVITTPGHASRMPAMPTYCYVWCIMQTLTTSCHCLLKPNANHLRLLP
jgi:hypothetical protein